MAKGMAAIYEGDIIWIYQLSLTPWPREERHYDGDFYGRCPELRFNFFISFVYVRALSVSLILYWSCFLVCSAVRMIYNTMCTISKRKHV